MAHISTPMLNCSRNRTNDTAVTSTYVEELNASMTTDCSKMIWTFFTSDERLWTGPKHFFIGT